MAEVSVGHDHAHDDHHEPGFFTRWFCSTNHKDIGILYLWTAGFFGLIAIIFSMMMRAELMYPGVQFMTLEDGSPKRPDVERADHRRMAS